MLVNDLRHLLRSVPFEPFQMVLVTGETFDVRHRDFLTPVAGSRSAVVHMGVTGQATVLNTGMIVKVQFLQEQGRTATA